VGALFAGRQALHPASSACSRQRRNRLSEISCSRQSSAIERSPRQLAITSSSICCALNFRYLRVSLNVCSDLVERPIL